MAITYQIILLITSVACYFAYPTSEDACLTECAPEINDPTVIMGLCTTNLELAQCISANPKCFHQLQLIHDCFISAECKQKLGDYEINPYVAYDEHMKKICRLIEDESSCFYHFLFLLQTSNGQVMKDPNIFNDFKRMLQLFTRDHSKSCQTKVKAIVQFEDGKISSDQFRTVMNQK